MARSHGSPISSSRFSSSRPAPELASGPKPIASAITALLGPTNTGKTHRAIERMLEHPSGMIGLPLRLLAREVYDRITTRLGEREVALVTGEEKRIPPRPRYWVCTVEAMPMDQEVDFVAVDEIQLVAHRERGHVFTERLLHARGTVETWFLGSETAKNLVEHLAPTAHVRRHPRLSRLRHAGTTTLGGLPPRSAVVAFSAHRVYEIAERLRERRGGAAVVLGALSPRARNAQVALYQSGEVDYLVATDAIGMGLNLDVLHVAFADLRKFDGHESRPLEASELSQIAGRAGRYLNDGTFGTLSPLEPLRDGAVHAIESHVFPPEPFAWWRNAELDTSSVAALVDSLKRPSRNHRLKLCEQAADFAALVELSQREAVRERALHPETVELLWTVCQIPDYSGLLVDFHADLLSEVFLQLERDGRLGTDWLAARIARLDDVEGDIEALLARMAGIRTFTYMSYRAGWVDDAIHFQERARAIEDRLSDALHLRLVARFVDRGGHRRGAIARKRPRSLRADDGPQPAKDGPFAQLLQLREALERKAASSHHAAADDDTWFERLVDAPYERFRLDDKGHVLDGTEPIARLTRGHDLLSPEVAVTLDLGSGERSRLQRRLVAWSRDFVAELLRPLRHESLRELSPAGRGLVYQLEHSLGCVRAATAKTQLRTMTTNDRSLLSRTGVRLGHLVVHVDGLLESKTLSARAALYRAYRGDAPALPERVRSVRVDPAFGAEAYAALGFVTFGNRAIRADLVERVRKALRDALRSGAGGPPTDVVEWLGCDARELPAIAAAFGYPPAAYRKRRAAM